MHHDLYSEESRASLRVRRKGTDTVCSSSSLISASGLKILQSDRYIASPADNPVPMMATPRSHSLARALGMAASRRLVFSEHRANEDCSPSMPTPLHSLKKNLNRSLYETPPPPSMTSARTNLQQAPVITLNAPGLKDDFYSRPAAWSRSGVVAVGTRHSINFRDMVTGAVGCLTRLITLDVPTCLEWSPNPDILAVGFDWGDTQLFDIRTQTQVLEIPGLNYIGGMSWNGEHLLTVAGENGMIRHYDARISGRNGSVLNTNGHNIRVCGVKWSEDRRHLISGSGDGVVMLWDARASKGLELFDSSNLNTDPSPSDGTLTPTPASPSVLHRAWRNRRHTSTVKALAWCPWQPDIFASGGGTRDGTIRIWSVSTGACTRVIKTRAQVSSVHFAQSCREVVSTCGYAFAVSSSDIDIDGTVAGGNTALGRRRVNAMLMHSVVNGEVTGRVFDAGQGRISDSVMSPDGTRVLTCGSDNTIRIHRVFGEKIDWEEEKATLWQRNLIR